MRKMLIVTSLLMMAALGGLETAGAQDSSKQSSVATQDSVDAYRLELSFNELEDGKKLNTRHYSIDLTGGRENTINIGTRIPVAAANCNAPSSSQPAEQYQYLDLGTHIWAQLINHGNELHVSGEVSSLDTSAGPETSARLLPVIRRIKIEGSTALVLGKPIIIGSADDPNSRRQFELEATITKLK